LDTTLSGMNSNVTTAQRSSQHWRSKAPWRGTGGGGGPQNSQENKICCGLFQTKFCSSERRQRYRSCFEIWKLHRGSVISTIASETNIFSSDVAIYVLCNPYFQYPGLKRNLGKPV